MKTYFESSIKGKVQFSITSAFISSLGYGCVEVVAIVDVLHLPSLFH